MSGLLFKSYDCMTARNDNYWIDLNSCSSPLHIKALILLFFAKFSLLHLYFNIFCFLIHENDNICLPYQFSLIEPRR